MSKHRSLPWILLGSLALLHGACTTSSGNPTPKVSSDGEVAPDGETEGDGDALVGPDEGEETTDDGGSELEAAGIAAGCSLQCEDILADCGDAFDSLAECLSQCQADGAADGWRLASYACLASSPSCDATLCLLDEGTLEEVSGCRDACEALDGCDLLNLMNLPEDQPDLCTILCSGAATGDDETAEDVTCIIENVATDCSQSALEGCVGPIDSSGAGGLPSPGELCAAFCTEMYTPGTNEFCAPGSALLETWPTSQECQTACGTLADSNAVVRFWGCIIGANCGDAQVCQDIPETDYPGCTAGCDALIPMCTDHPDFDDLALCEPLCTGVLMHYGSADPNASTCVEAHGTCTEEEDPLGILLGCALPKPPACYEVCAGLVGCLEGSDDAITNEDCLSFCAAGGLGTGEALEATATCVDGAGFDCGTLLACFTWGVDGLCSDFCQKILGPAEDGGCAEDTLIHDIWDTTQECVDACAPLGDNEHVLRFAGCVHGSACGDVTPCTSPPSEDDPSCISACASVTELCSGDGLTLEEATCAPYCTGWLIPSGGVGDPAPEACLGEYETCPEGDAQLGAVVLCATPKPLACNIICPQMATCPKEDSPITEQACINQCAAGTWGTDAELQTAATCVAFAGDTCESYWGCLE